MAVSNAAVAAPSSCAAPQWQRSFSRSLSRRKRFEQVGCELAQGHIAIGCNRQRIKAGGLRDRRRLRPGLQEFVHPIDASRVTLRVTTESVRASIVLRTMSFRRATFFDVLAVITQKGILPTQ